MESLYSRVVWQDDSATPLNANNLNIMDKGIADLDERLVNIFNYVYPIGAVVTTNTNTSPSETFGGTWELIDKQFAGEIKTDTDWLTLSDTADVIDGSVVVRSGHVVRARIRATVNRSMGDGTYSIITLDFAKLGISGIPNPYASTSFTDVQNGLVQYNVGEDGILRVTDALTKTDHVIAAGTTFGFTFEAIIPYTNMIDDFCNQFVWKRTA